MRKNVQHFLFFFLVSFILFAQVQHEVNPPEYIKSIVFKGPLEGDQFPIIKLGEPVTLNFDDLTATEPDYYYTLTHCNYDWTPSNLVKQQYLRGVDNVRILNYQNSFNTLQPYSNFRLQIPNNQTGILLSGNYILKVFDNQQELMFSRRFVVYEDLATVGVSIARPRDLSVFNEKQSVQFIINAGDLQLRNPNQEVKVAVLKNYHWDSAITDLKPQFVLGNQLTYRYDKASSFWAGNEFFNFENKDIRGATVNIASVKIDAIYHNYLYTNESRKDEPYTYFPDINGDFLITVLNRDPFIEADYAFIYFSLDYPKVPNSKSVHIYGKFNNYAVDDSTRMEYDDETGLYHAKLLLKQGFYNYKYVVVDKKGTIDENAICGNFLPTENNYLVLVYFRKFGALYDTLIGIGSGNSSTLTN
ncbi:DUF5103 domain-containing protein [Sungkyunkwania multivorans]|uniref:DUF5103 domain-containing protein n=1 Tax=Sungkyunkwania multivorans TaxID=1173618 RepID=A0ABW3CYU7_9FLAO